ncbi:DUF1705 domain-containing protein [Acinetobacter junii]|uniref:DUF1705 domain-containing protein n=1 Tax=Acinetobacter junii TaxID=40215 RepID=A0AAX1MEX9_ACIJU|nr:DUF1705 domain-containing protein [Acinetobacter junii]
MVRASYAVHRVVVFEVAIIQLAVLSLLSSHQSEVEALFLVALKLWYFVLIVCPAAYTLKSTKRKQRVQKHQLKNLQTHSKTSDVLSL